MSMFYTYLWLRYDGTPYYVGKGKGLRAFEKDNHCCNPPVDQERIIIQEWLSEDQAFEAEKFIIGYYGRIDIKTGCLRNLTDGGEGSSGGHWVLSIETRRKHSEAAKKQKRYPVSEETRRKLSEAGKGNIRGIRNLIPGRKFGSHYTMSEEHKRRIGETNKIALKGNINGHGNLGCSRPKQGKFSSEERRIRHNEANARCRAKKIK